MVATRRVLMLTADRIGPSMAGPAIRATELAGVLAGDGHDVVLAAPWIDTAAGTTTAGTTTAGTTTTDTADGLATGPNGVHRVQAWGDDLRPLAANADVVVAMTGVLFEHPWLAGLRSSGVHIVADAYDPVLFEVLAGHTATAEPERSNRIDDAAARMCDPLRWADLVLCATTSQRHLLLGVLAAQRRLGAAAYDDDPRLGSVVAEVPFGLPASPPIPPSAGTGPLRGPGGPFGDGDTILLWGGGLWDWLDPVTLVQAVAACGDPSVKVFFMAGAHPTPTVPDMAMAHRARTAAAAAGLDATGTGQVVFADRWVPYDERSGYLCDADVGVSLAPDHVETTFAYRTRVLDYLWASLPVLCSSGDDLASVVERHGLGVVVPPEDVAAVARAISVVGEAGWYADVRTRVASMATTVTWPTVARPLRAFCQEPRSLLSEPPTPTPVTSGVTRRVLSGVRRRLVQP
jgi:hypothetical protein